MKVRRTIGGVLFGMGCAVTFVGILATVLPMIQNDQLQLDDVSRRVLEIQEEEKRLMQVLQEKEAFNASRRSEVDQQKQGVLVAKQVLAEKNRRLVQLNEDLKEQEELYSSEKKLLLQRRATQQVCVVCGIECRKN